MSVDLGLAAFPLDTFTTNIMARELGGWDYNDLWATNLQLSAPMPYSAPLPFNTEALSLPYSASARCRPHAHHRRCHFSIHLFVYFMLMHYPSARARG